MALGGIRGTVIEALIGTDLLALTSDPAKPGEGNALLYVSDGNEYGNPGDIIAVSTINGVTKRTILFSYVDGNIWS